jgi:hypothetical protein
MNIRASLFSSVASLVLLSGCFVSTPSDPGASGGASSQGAENADTAALDKLRASLEGHRTQAFDKSAMELDAHGSTLYFKTYPGFDPVLHRMNADGTKLDYAFSLGSGDDANDRASEDLVVVAQRNGDKITYHAYDAHASNAEKGSTDLPTPTDEQKWWAYAVSGSTVYVITTPTEATGTGNSVWSYTPGGSAQKLFTLEDAGMQVGELLDFDVDGTTMMVIESGRLWRVDMSAKKATWLGNKTEISGAVDFAKDGVAWEEAAGLKFFDYGSNDVRDLSAEIKGSGYQINATYSDAHLFYSKTTSNNFSRWGSWIVYTANLGIFAYDLSQKRVAPVLIDVDEASGHRVDYTYPVVLANGAAFVVGLTSDDGAVGADGPVYRTDLTSLLPQ